MKPTSKSGLLNDRNLLPIRSRSLCRGNASRSSSNHQIIVIESAHIYVCDVVPCSFCLLSTYAEPVLLFDNDRRNE